MLFRYSILFRFRVRDHKLMSFSTSTDLFWNEHDSIVTLKWLMFCVQAYIWHEMYESCSVIFSDKWHFGVWFSINAIAYCKICKSMSKTFQKRRSTRLIVSLSRRIIFKFSEELNVLKTMLFLLCFRAVTTSVSMTRT